MLGLLEYEKYEYVWMDDADKDDTLLDQADRIVVTPGISPKHMIYQKYSHKLVGELDLCWEILEKYAMLDRVKFYCIT